MNSLLRMNSYKTFVNISKRSIYINPVCQNEKITKKMNQYDKIGFFGTGNMTRIIIQALITKRKFLPEQIYVTEKNVKYLEYLKNEEPFFQSYKINFTDENEILNKTNVLMLCAKPHEIKEFLFEASHKISENHLIILIAAGIKLDKIQECLINHARVIRIMTNAAALIHEGCSVYSRGRYATDADALFTNEMLLNIGSCEGEIKEDLIDVVTALASSGPAYNFLILESLTDGAERMGLDKNLAIRLASQTMLGAASMVLEQLNEKEHGKHIMQMKEEVCSPGGTTINGIAQLEKYRVRSALINCIEEATKSTARLNMTN